MGRPDSIWVNSGKRVGGSKVKLFVITGHSSESVAFARGWGLLCPAPQLVTVATATAAAAGVNNNLC